MINKDFFAALNELEKDRRIDKDLFIESLEAGLVSAYKRETGEARPIMVKLNETKNEIKVYAYKTVVEEVAESDKEISLEDAREIKKAYKINDMVMEDVTPKDLSRIAIQTAKQVVMQRINDFKKDQIMAEMSEKEGEIALARVHKVEGETVYLEIIATQMEAVMSGPNRVTGEKYNIGDELKVFVKNARSNTRIPQVIVSRSVAGFVKRLFESEVPEVKSGSVVIKGIVRDAGYRTKMSVYTDSTNIDAVGACIGQRGVRINAVVNELNGEKVDIVPWNEDPVEYIAAALSPAKVLRVQIDEESRSARVIVPFDKLSLAIGKGGQNVRLAAKLTGWKIDVKPDTDEETAEDDIDGEIDEIIEEEISE